MKPRDFYALETRVKGEKSGEWSPWIPSGLGQWATAHGASEAAKLYCKTWRNAEGRAVHYAVGVIWEP